MAYQVIPPEFTQPRPSGWICATCGRLVTCIEDGWVEWLACEVEGLTFTKGLRLVHRDRSDARKRGGCQYDGRGEFQRDKSIVEGLALERFLGPDGLMLLLSLIATGEMPLNELVELGKRVQIPGYEQTRQVFPLAIPNGVLSPAIGSGFYLQSEIRSLLHWATVAA
jgi:hypothetical protein